MAQFGRPSADTAIGSWTDQAAGTTDIYQTIDETSASDADYIESEANPSSSTCKIALSSLTDPVSSSSHTVRYRYAKRETGAGQPSVVDVSVELVEGTTNRAGPNSHTDVTTSFTDGSFTLSAGEADAISDYTNLFLIFSANQTGGARTGYGQFSWAELEVPNAPGAVGTSKNILLLGVG